MTVPGLRRSLVIVLAIKAAIIVLAAIFVFGPAQRPHIDHNALDRQILGHLNSTDQEDVQ